MILSLAPTVTLLEIFSAAIAKAFRGRGAKEPRPILVTLAAWSLVCYQKLHVEYGLGRESTLMLFLLHSRLHMSLTIYAHIHVSDLVKPSCPLVPNGY